MTIAFLILNIIEAITEFLPISSSGHIIVAEWLYGISEKGLEAFLHLPAALAILIVFWGAYMAIIKDRKTWPIILATIIPAGIVGILFGDYIDAIFYSPLVVGINQIAWGAVLLYTAVRHQNTKPTYKVTSWKNLTWVQAFKIGLLQVVALIPGTSRSGITTLAGMWNGMAPQESASYSFIAGFPVILGAALVGLYKMVKAGTTFALVTPVWLIVGMLVSLILSIFAIKLFTSKYTLTVMKYSGIYRIVLGLLIFLWLI